MGLTLMADDRDLILGGLVEGFKGIKEHLDRQDKQRDTDRVAAIAAREAKHAENLSRFQALDEKVTTTFGLATVAYNWVTQKAPALNERVDKIDSRVKAIEDGKTLDAAEERGALKTWGLIGAIATAIGTVLAGIITYGRDAIEMLKGLHHGG